LVVGLLWPPVRAKQDTTRTRRKNKTLVAALMFEAAMKRDEKKKRSPTPSKHTPLPHHTAAITFKH